MSFEKHEKNEIMYFTSSLFDGFDIPHFFAAKRGGVSGGAFGSLNVSTSRRDEKGRTDTPFNVRQNLARGLALVGADEKCACMMRQIHSANIEKAQVSCADCFDGRGDFQPCDGVFAHKGMPYDTLAVKTADCVPVLLYDTKNDVAMALHAGWRGTVGNICGRAVEKMKELFADAEIVAAIGPCIMDCCYEVNDVVYDAAMKSCQIVNKMSNDVDGVAAINYESVNKMSNDVEKCFPVRYFADGERKYRVSLSALNRLFLENAGVKSENIDEARICTCCHTDEDGAVFFSHRASGGFSGTQMSVVRLKK